MGAERRLYWNWGCFTFPAPMLPLILELGLLYFSRYDDPNVNIGGMGGQYPPDLNHAPILNLY